MKMKEEGYCINRPDLSHAEITNWLWQSHATIPVTNLFYYHRPSGRTEAELQENIEKDNTVAADLRDKDGNHNWSYKQKNGDPQPHGRVWITVPLLPEEAGEFDKMLLRKIIIDHPRDV